MSSNSQPRAIPDRGLQTRRQALGSYNMAHLFSTYSPQAPRLELSNHDTSTAVLDQGPHTPDADTPYGSISPLLSSSVPSRPSLLEAYWNQFGRIRTSYRTNHALQYFLGVGEGVAATADHAPYTPSSTGPQSTSFMSLDGDTPQLYVGSDVAVSGSTQPGHRPPPEFEYVNSKIFVHCSSILFCISDNRYQI
jgi:hypothetical protein